MIHAGSGRQWHQFDVIFVFPRSQMKKIGMRGVYRSCQKQENAKVQCEIDEFENSDQCHRAVPCRFYLEPFLLFRLLFMSCPHAESRSY